MSGGGAHAVVRCSGVAEDGPCSREQAIDATPTQWLSDSDVIGIQSAWLASFGWRHESKRWLCPFCVAKGGLS